MTDISFEKNELEKVLSKVSSLKEANDKVLQATGENYNIFRVLWLDDDELVFSRMIANLLNVKAKDGLSFLRLEFLKFFIEKTISTFPEIEFDYQSAKIEIEKSIGTISSDKQNGGRLDIFITIQSITHEQYAFVIENKVNAEDQPYQLIRYKNFMDKQYPQKNSIIYLTLSGKNPSKESSGIDFDNLNENSRDVFWDCISYQNEIIEWLNFCAEKAIKYPYMRESINQFRSQIQRLTGGDFSMMNENEIVEVLANNPAITQTILNKEYQFHRYLIEKLFKATNELRESSIDWKNCKTEEVKLWKKGAGYFYRKTPASPIKIGFGIWYEDLRQISCALWIDKGDEKLSEELRNVCRSLEKGDFEFKTDNLDKEKKERIWLNMFTNYSWVSQTDRLLCTMKWLMTVVDEIQKIHPELF